MRRLLTVIFLGSLLNSCTSLRPGGYHISGEKFESTYRHGAVGKGRIFAAGQNNKGEAYFTVSQFDVISKKSYWVTYVTEWASIGEALRTELRLRDKTPKTLEKELKIKLSQERTLSPASRDR